MCLHGAALHAVLSGDAAAALLHHGSAGLLAALGNQCSERVSVGTHKCLSEHSAPPHTLPPWKPDSGG